MPAFLNPAEAEFWVGAGLVIFLLIVVWKGRKAALGALDAKAVQIQANLDEAARLRAEAETLLASIRAQRAESERQAAEMIAAAEADARRVQAEAEERLREQIARRADLAERKIAQAEAQAAQDVKAAAVDMAARAAETVLAGRVAAGGSDPMIDSAVEQLARKLS